MSNAEVWYNSREGVTLKMDHVPTVEEQKMIDTALAPDGYIITQFMKKAKMVDEYMKDNLDPAAKPPVTPANYAPKEEKPKQEFKKCPNCGRNSLTLKTVKKEGANKGKKFYSCLNKTCGNTGKDGKFYGTFLWENEYEE